MHQVRRCETCEVHEVRGVHPATYDRDTPKALRSELRRRSNVILTNPDMLNVGLLPSHDSLWADFFRNLRIVAVDEAHLLRGVFEIGIRHAKAAERAPRPAPVRGVDLAEDEGRPVRRIRGGGWSASSPT